MRDDISCKQICNINNNDNIKHYFCIIQFQYIFVHLIVISYINNLVRQKKMQLSQKQKEFAWAVGLILTSYFLYEKVKKSFRKLDRSAIQSQEAKNAIQHMNSEYLAKIKAKDPNVNPNVILLNKPYYQREPLNVRFNKFPYDQVFKRMTGGSLYFIFGPYRLQKQIIKDLPNYLNKGNINSQSVIRCELKQVNILREALKYKLQHRYQNQKLYQTFFYSVLEHMNIINFEEKYFSAMTQIQLNPLSLVIYGKLEFDQLSNMFELQPKLIGRYKESILQYYDLINAKSFFQCLGWIVLFSMTTYFTYKNVKYLKNIISIIKERLFGGLNEKKDITFVLSDPADKLLCKMCKIKSAEIVFSCSHLNVCVQCSQKIENCLQCNQKITKKIRLYQA